MKLIYTVPLHIRDEDSMIFRIPSGTIDKYNNKPGIPMWMDAADPILNHQRVILYIITNSCLSQYQNLLCFQDFVYFTVTLVMIMFRPFRKYY